MEMGENIKICLQISIHYVTWFIWLQIAFHTNWTFGRLDEKLPSIMNDCGTYVYWTHLVNDTL